MADLPIVYVPCYDPNPLPHEPGVHMQTPPRLSVEPVSVNHVRIAIDGKPVIVDGVTLSGVIRDALRKRDLLHDALHRPA